MSDPDRAAAHVPWVVVPSHPRHVGHLRRHAGEVCRAAGWGEESAATVALLVSEVAGNALLHAYGPELGLRVLDLGLRLRVELRDGSPELPVARRAHTSAESGRGLALVEALAVAWGVEMHPDGKTAWFEIGV